jgi:hypothetical protein
MNADVAADPRAAKPALRVTRNRLRAVTTNEFIGGRWVRVQRPRAPFAIFVGGNDL